MSSTPVFTLRALTQKMPVPTVTSYGTSLVFDFGLDSGQYILASSVALSGFQLMYATQDNQSYESISRCGLKLTPTLVGSKVQVTVGLVLTDYNGDGAAEPQDVSDRESYAYVTVLAVVGSAAASSYALCNVYGLGSAGSQNIPIPANPASQTVFLSGFDFAYPSGDSNGVLGLVTTCGSRTGTAANTTQLTGSATMDPSSKYSSTSTVDLGFLAAATPGTGQVQSFALASPTFSWNDPDDENGITGTLSASFAGLVPSGYQLSSAVFLLSSITLEYGGGNYHDVGILAAGLTGALTCNTSNNTVSASVVMNVYADEPTQRVISSDDSSLSGYVLGLFTPVAS